MNYETTWSDSCGHPKLNQKTVYVASVRRMVQVAVCPSCKCYIDTDDWERTTPYQQAQKS